MLTIDAGAVLLSGKEYAELSNPGKCYTFLTKTKAKAIVVKLLRDNKRTCWNDDEHPDDEGGCCSACPVYTVLGRDGGDVICTHHKRWSK